jgi:antirestriction protein
VQTYIENRELRDFQDIIDNCSGTYSSPEDYVQGYWEDCGDFKANDTQWWHPSNYTDWARMAHDLEMSGDVDFIPCDGGVMVFNSF